MLTKIFGYCSSDWCQSNLKHEFYPPSTKDLCIRNYQADYTIVLIICCPHSLQ